MSCIRHHFYLVPRHAVLPPRLPLVTNNKFKESLMNQPDSGTERASLARLQHDSRFFFAAVEHVGHGQARLQGNRLQWVTFEWCARKDVEIRAPDAVIRFHRHLHTVAEPGVEIGQSLSPCWESPVNPVSSASWRLISFTPCPVGTHAGAGVSSRPEYLTRLARGSPGRSSSSKQNAAWPDKGRRRSSVTILCVAASHKRA